MNVENVTDEEIEALRIWTGESRPLTREQQLLAVALERLGCNQSPAKLAAYCDTTEEHILELKKGIPGILVDANTGRFWIR